MKISKLIAFLLIIVIAIVAFIFFRAFARFGEFTRLRPQFDGLCEQKITNLAGIEDIQAFNKNGKDFIVFSSFDRQGARKNKNLGGAIYIAQTNDFVAKKISTNFIKPVGIGFINADEPILMAINNANNKSQVDIYVGNIDGNFSFHKSVNIDGAYRLNDVVPISKDSFYVTNESEYKNGSIKNFIMNILDLDKSGAIFYYDGKSAKKIVDGLSFANSIALSNDSKKLYASATFGRNLKIFLRNQENGQLTPIDDIFLGTGVDNLSIDNENRVFVAAHPKLFTLIGKMWFNKGFAPSQMLVIEPNKSGEGGLIDQVYLANGDGNFAETSVGVKDNNQLIMGSIYAKGLNVCQLPKEWHQSKSHPAQKLIDMARDVKIIQERKKILRGE